MKVMIVLLVLVNTAPVLAAVEVSGIRLWQAPQRTRLVFDLSKPSSYKLLSLKDPSRLVFDFPGGTLKASIPSTDSFDSILGAIRSGHPKPNILRLVLDLKMPVKSRVFALEPAGLYGHRLVVDLSPRDTIGGDLAQSPLFGDNYPKEYVIVVDPGHGGEDPGAIGYRGSREKEVVLRIALRLARLIDKEPGMRAVLTRNADYYLSLRNRVEKARRERASVFVSIHADAFHKTNVQGFSVYSLSDRGATSEMAALLAERENAADLAGGVRLKNRDPNLAETLLDMQLDWKIKESKLLGNEIFKELSVLGNIHSSRVEQAGFVVLKAPAIPSVLIETGYITNRKDANRLKQIDYQERVAAAILRGVLSYCHDRPECPLPVTENRVHLVKTGDSLSSLAIRYGVSIDSIKRRNGLRSDEIMIRQKLIIPIPAS